MKQFAAKPQRVNSEQELHQIVVRWFTGALKDENVFTANVLVQFYGDFAIGEFINFSATQLKIKAACHLFG